MTKLIITTDEGEVLGVIEALESWDLNKALARAELMLEIQEILEEHDATT